MKRMLAVSGMVGLLLARQPAQAAPLTPEEMDTVCRHFAAVVAGIAVQRDAGKSKAKVKGMVRELLKGQELDWSFPLLDEGADDVYGQWAHLPPKQVRTAWHQWCMTTALTPEK